MAPGSTRPMSGSPLIANHQGRKTNQTRRTRRILSMSCTCPARERTLQGRGLPGAGEPRPRDALSRDLRALPAALVPETPWEPRDAATLPVRSSRAPTAAEAPAGRVRERTGQGVRVNTSPVNPRRQARAGRRGRYSPRAVERAPGRGAVPGRARRVRVGRSRADCGGHACCLCCRHCPRLLGRRGRCLRGEDRPLPPPSAGPSLCPRPGPRAATWARRGAAPGSAGRAHPWRLDAGGPGPAAAPGAALGACRPAGRCCLLQPVLEEAGLSLLPTHRHPHLLLRQLQARLPHPTPRKRMTAWKGPQG